MTQGMQSRIRYVVLLDSPFNFLNIVEVVDMPITSSYTFKRSHQSDQMEREDE